MFLHLVFSSTVIWIMSFVIILTVSRTENSFKRKEAENFSSTHSSAGHQNLKLGILVGLQKEVQIEVQIQSHVCAYGNKYEKSDASNRKLALQHFQNI